jgi:hypothetical protein
MLQALKDWWNKDSIAEAALNKRFDELAAKIISEQEARLAAEAAKEALEEQLTQAKEEVGIYRAQEEADRAKREGTEPWVEIKSADYSETKGIHIELDWNEAFIQYLKDNGIKGKDEELTVQKWLAFLYQDLIDRLEQKAIDKSDKPRVNDFE